MKRFTFFFTFIISSISLSAQGGWTWQLLPPMPMQTSNNAVAAATVGDTTFVYSFAGIDNTKLWSGIHTKAFRYNMTTQLWDTIPELPDSLGGVIAASASTINNKIYIIGGYHVYSGGNELSSYQTHIYDPSTNSYSLGQNIPLAIDDQVQFTYKDSLIYVITGWSSDLNPDRNTNEVQIYDPLTDQWQSGTPTPNNNNYRAFGAQGTVVGDTIYYAGGTEHSNFSLKSNFRKGMIDAQDPTIITWGEEGMNPGYKLYRPASLTVGRKAFCIGGGNKAYNYNGLAYSNGSGTEPTTRILEFNDSTKLWAEHVPAPYGIMDLRGIAMIDKYNYVLCGGMDSGQQVSNRVFLLTYDSTYVSSTDSIPDTTAIVKEHEDFSIDIYPNPFSSFITIMFSETKHLSNCEMSVINILGKEQEIPSRIQHNNCIKVSTEDWKPGIYYLSLFTDKILLTKKIVKTQP